MSSVPALDLRTEFLCMVSGLDLADKRDLSVTVIGVSGLVDVEPVVLPVALAADGSAQAMPG